MLTSFECPVCRQINDVCLIGGFDTKIVKCEGCGSKLEITEGSENNILEAKELEEDSCDLEETVSTY
jgi:transcription elongation factor Elf1